MLGGLLLWAFEVIAGLMAAAYLWELCDALGSEYWRPLIGFLRDRMLRDGTIDLVDIERLFITDSPQEAVQSLADAAQTQFGLTYGPRAKRRWFLGE